MRPGSFRSLQNSLASYAKLYDQKTMRHHFSSGAGNADEIEASEGIAPGCGFADAAISSQSGLGLGVLACCGGGGAWAGAG